MTDVEYRASWHGVRCTAWGPGGDPLGFRVNFPFQTIFHPMGYAVDISSNSAIALNIASELWSRYPSLSTAVPIRLRVISCRSQVGINRQSALSTE